MLMVVGWVGLSPLAFIFGISRIFSGLRHKDLTDIWLIWLWVFLLILGLIYPARQAADLAWMSVPFLALAARQAARIQLPEENHFAALGYAGLVVVLFVSIAINFSGLIVQCRPLTRRSAWLGCWPALFYCWRVLDW